MMNATTPAPLPLWQQRFFVPMVVGAQVAHGNPARGMAISTAAG